VLVEAVIAGARRLASSDPEMRSNPGKVVTL